MPINSGLLIGSAIANALSSGIDTYQQRKRYENEEADRKARLDIEKKRYEDQAGNTLLHRAIQMKAAGLRPVSTDIDNSQPQGDLGQNQPGVNDQPASSDELADNALQSVKSKAQPQGLVQPPPEQGLVHPPMVAPPPPLPPQGLVQPQAQQGAAQPQQPQQPQGPAQPTQKPKVANPWAKFGMEEIPDNELESRIKGAGDVGKLIKQLYPGKFDDVDFSNIRPNDLGNFFKVQRLRENQQNRKDIEGMRNVPNDNSGTGLASRGIRSGGSHDPKAVERYQKQIITATKPFDQVLHATDNIDAFADIAKTNPDTYAALPVMLARAVGEKGKLSNVQLQAWGGSQAVADRLRRMAQKMSSGTFPESDIGFFKEIGSTLRNASIKAKSDAENDIIGKYSSNYGGEPTDNYRLITGRNQELTPKEDPVMKKEYSPSRKQTRITYQSGRTELVDGDKR